MRILPNHISFQIIEARVIYLQKILVFLLWCCKEQRRALLLFILLTTWFICSSQQLSSTLLCLKCKSAMSKFLRDSFNFSRNSVLYEPFSSFKNKKTIYSGEYSYWNSWVLFFYRMTLTLWKLYWQIIHYWPGWSWQTLAIPNIIFSWIKNIFYEWWWSWGLAK